MAHTTRKICKTLPKQSFNYHSRKCVICRHPDRAAIEEEFVHWGGVWDIARIYQLGDYRSIYRHAHATGLTLRRRENLHSVLDIFLEKARGANMSGDSILRAIRAYSCVDSMGRWVDPPTQMNYSIAQAGAVTPAPHLIAPTRAASAAQHQPSNSTSQRSTVIDLDLDENVEPDVIVEDDDSVESDENEEADEDVDLDENVEPDVIVEDDENDEPDENEEADEDDDDNEGVADIQDSDENDDPDEDLENDEDEDADENVEADENEDAVEGQDTDENDHEPCADGESALENVAVLEADGESASKTDSALETDGKAALENAPALKTYPVAKSKPVPAPALVLATSTGRKPAPAAKMNSALATKTSLAPKTAQTPPPFQPAVTNPAPMYGVLTDAGQINGGAIRMACIPLKTNDGNPVKSTVKTTFRPAHFARRNRRRK